MSHGSIPGIPCGAVFRTRRGLYEAGLHRDVHHDIAVGGEPELGAESVIVTDSLEDNLDLSTVIYLTGNGGRDKRGRQIADQAMVGLNASLAINVDTKLPIRVIRTIKREFDYGGLFVVEDAFLTEGSSGNLICRFRLHKSNRELSPRDIAAAYAELRRPARRLTTHFQLVRDSALPTVVKRLYKFTCQVCGVRLETVAGPYAEAAHLLPLGGGSNGPDHLSNLLCLCPNHHVLLDHGAIFLADDWTVTDSRGVAIGRLAVNPDHGLDATFARQHRQLFFRHDS